METKELNLLKTQKNTEGMETKELNLNYEEALELYVLLSRRISDINRDYSSNPELAHRYAMRLQDIQTRVVSLLDSFSYENRED